MCQKINKNLAPVSFFREYSSFQENKRHGTRTTPGKVLFQGFCRQEIIASGFRVFAQPTQEEVYIHPVLTFETRLRGR